MATTDIDPLEMMLFDDIKTKQIAKDRKTLKAWMDLPKDQDPFPKPIELGPRRIAWRRCDVEAWVQKRQRA